MSLILESPILYRAATTWFDADSKEFLCAYPFEDIFPWSSDAEEIKIKLHSEKWGDSKPIWFEREHEDRSRVYYRNPRSGLWGLLMEAAADAIRPLIPVDACTLFFVEIEVIRDWAMISIPDEEEEEMEVTEHGSV